MTKQKKKYVDLKCFIFKYFQLFLTVGLISFSCSESKQYSGKEIQVKVGPKITTYYADTDLSSVHPFPRFTFVDSNRLLAHNMVRSSLDTLFFESDSLRIKEGPYYDSDGPRKIENFNNLVSTTQGLVFFNGKNIMVDFDGVSEIENFRLVNFDLFEKSIFFGLKSGVSFSLDELFRAYDKTRSRLYFYASDFESKRFLLVAFNLIEKKFEELPIWVNVDLVQANQVAYRNLSKNNMPFIFYDQNRLFLSYNYSYEIVVVNLISERAVEKSFSSNLFPLNKQAPKEIKQDYDLQNREGFEKVWELLSEWDDDVSFGNFEKLPNGKGFCRIVKSPNRGLQNLDQINLEVFDSFLEKVGEVNLTELESDLSTFYFSVENKLFFKAKNQENENYLNYYFVEIDF